MGIRSGGFNAIERETVFRLRELFSRGREASVQKMSQEDAAFVEKWSELALYPEKPLLSFGEEAEDAEFYRLARQLCSKSNIRRLITCGGVDDGKSTLIGRILYDTKSKEEQEAIQRNPAFLRQDNSVDYALLAGTSEEEARQGITVSVSDSIFDWGNYRFLMADVPGHEEYTHNMAFAASTSDTAVIMLAANKGIVPQTRRHTRICYFMGIRTMIFAVNKMDMAAFRQEVFAQLAEEIAQMMEEYENCTYKIVPAAAKSGVNIIKPGEEMPWYQGGSLLDVLAQTKERQLQTAGYVCMPVQRICKSSQIKGAVIKKRVIQGELLSGRLQVGDEVFIYPTGRRANIAGIYCLDQMADTAEAGAPVGIELDRELDVARGYVVTNEDVLSLTDRIEVDLLWISDNRLTQGKRYRVKIGTSEAFAAVTKICYQVDVNTGEHRYAEYITRNGLARCELCFPKQMAVACEKELHRFGTIRVMEREKDTLAAYGNIIHTVSGEAWKEDGREVTALERELALGQKAGLILFANGESAQEQMNFTERYLLRMGFHTIQAAPGQLDERKLCYIRSFLEAGLIVLLLAEESEKAPVMGLLEEKTRIFDCQMSDTAGSGPSGYPFQKMKQWASGLI